MFRYREEGEYGRGYDTPCDWQVTNLALDVKNIGKVIKTSKREYHWRFDVRNPREADGGSWKLVSIILTDSCVSQKRSLMVNSKKIIDQEKM